MATDGRAKKGEAKPRRKETGHVYAQVTLGGVTGQRRVRAMVDTGSTLSVVPTRIAEDIGVPRLPITIRLRLADGSEVDAEAGPVVLSFRAIQVPATVVILPRAKPLLGAEALRSLRLTVSPKTGKLRRVGEKKGSLDSIKRTPAGRGNFRLTSLLAG